MNPDLSELTRALDRTDGYLTLRMWEEAWNTIEDAPSHWKNHPDRQPPEISPLDSE